VLLGRTGIMSAHACCSMGAASGQGARLSTKADEAGAALGRMGKFGSWIAPSAALVLVPKCPMCLAGYLALAGVGVSVPVAAGLRVGLIAASITVLGLAIGRFILRLAQ